MLNENQIRAALRADRVIPLNSVAPHGPLGMEQLAEEVRRLTASTSLKDSSATVSRPIPLKTETWQKLDQVAQESSRRAPAPASASDVAVAIIEHYVASLSK